MLFPNAPCVRCALAAMFLALTAEAAHAGFVADGDLTDWGLSNVSNAASWTSGIAVQGSGTRSGPFFSYSYMLEDQSDSAGDGGALGPNAGGQNYDAEFMGVGVDGTNVRIVIVTGQRPDNLLARFSPGDIRIETNNGIYGVEVGGQQGGSGLPSVGLGSAGTFYTLSSNGFTTGYTLDTTSHVAGSVWKDGVWQLDPIVGGTPPLNGQQPVQLQFTGGTDVGDASSYIYKFSSSSPNMGQHAVIELSIPFSVFQHAIIQRIQWAPSCGNDFVYVNTGIHTPEPATFLMGLLGMAGVAGLRRFRRNDA